MDNKSVRVTIRLKEQTKNDLQKLADYNKRKLSDYIRVELEELCEKNVKKMSDKD